MVANLTCCPSILNASINATLMNLTGLVNANVNLMQPWYNIAINAATSSFIGGALALWGVKTTQKHERKRDAENRKAEERKIKREELKKAYLALGYQIARVVVYDFADTDELGLRLLEVQLLGSEETIKLSSDAMEKISKYIATRDAESKQILISTLNEITLQMRKELGLSEE